MQPLVVAIPGEKRRANELARRLQGEMASTEIRAFPDGETYVRIDSPVEGRDVIVVGSLNEPNPKLATLWFLARTAADIGARSVGLVAPYLPYLRQDDRFQPGEAVSSRYFGQLISQGFDWLVTVDPHLHRFDGLDDVYPIANRAVESANCVAQWISEHVDAPVIVGPDAESHQWVSAVAEGGQFPTMILEKVRRGDYDVEIEDPDSRGFANRQPVLVDDIISTGRTMVEAARKLDTLGMEAPICVGIHGLFADDALDVLHNQGVSEIVTCNTVDHATNAIDVTEPIAEGIRSILDNEIAMTVVSESSTG